MIITRIDYNWRYTDDGEIAGDDYDLYQIGVKGVVEIDEHPSHGDGDRWFYDVKFQDKTMIRIYNPNKVYFGDNKQITGNEDEK